MRSEPGRLVPAWATLLCSTLRSRSAASWATAADARAPTMARAVKRVDARIVMFPSGWIWIDGWIECLGLRARSLHADDGFGEGVVGAAGPLQHVIERAAQRLMRLLELHRRAGDAAAGEPLDRRARGDEDRSEEHTSELQSPY